MENGAISDGQIIASSWYYGKYTAYQGRLLNNAGSWAAASNDVNQWLQIDLGSQYTEVTGAATQGGDHYPHWVTRYRLQYSNDGVNFQYYMEQGQTFEKVIARFESCELHF